MSDTEGNAPPPENAPENVAAVPPSDGAGTSGTVAAPSASLAVAPVAPGSVQIAAAQACVWDSRSTNILKGRLEIELQELEFLRDCVYSLDAASLPLVEVVRKVTVFRNSLEKLEPTIRSIADTLKDRLIGAGQRDSQVEHNIRSMSLAVEGARVYLDELAAWAASESSPSRSRSSSSERVCVQSEHQDRLESTPLNAPPQASDDGVRFRYSFMNTESIARDGSRQWIRDSTQPPQAPQPPQGSAEPGQQIAAGVYFPQTDPNQRIRTQHPIAFSGVTVEIPSGSSVPPIPQMPKAEQASDLPSQTAKTSPTVMQPPSVGCANRSMSDQFSLGRKARQVPKFAGDLRKFREWEQLFKVFVDETPAPTIEKFNLLRNSLTGRAKEAIAHLQWEESHYQLAKEILADRFGDSKLAQKSHIKELDNLIERGTVSSGRLESFSETLSLNVRALVALGVTFIQLSTTTTQRVLKCLPLDLRERFIKKYAKQKLSNPAITELEFMLNFLELTIKVRREAEWDDRRQKPRASGYTENRFRNSHQSSQTSARDNHSFFAAGQNSRSPKNQLAQNGSRTAGPRQQRPPASRAGSGPSRSSAPIVHPPVVPFPGKPLSTATQATSSRADSTQRGGKLCIFCEGSHESWRCTRLLSHDERLEKIRDQEGCTTCLKPNHSAKNCRDGPRSNCPRCNGRHYLIMCKKARADAANFHISSLATTIGSQDTHSEGQSSEVEEPEILLQMAVVWIEFGESRCLARILLDTGAHRSYIASQAVHQIRSSPIAAIKTSVKTMGNAVSPLDTWLHRVTLRSRHDPEKSITIECIETPQISDSYFPEVTDNLGLLPVADRTKGEDSPRLLSIIVGAVDLAPIHTGTEKIFGRMLATSSIFGWLFSGTLHESPASTRTIALLSETRAALPAVIESDDDYGNAIPSLTMRDICKSGKTRDEALEADLRFLWEGEFMGFEDISSSVEEKNALTEQLNTFFDSTITWLPKGCYQLCLPFKDNLDALGDNEKLARSRLQSLIVKLRKKEGHLLAVDQEISKSIKEGFAERAPPRREGQLAHYLPLQAVFKYGTDSSTISKTRIVKDASARMSNRASLNDCLHQGENLLPLIPSVLCAFRECLYPVTADIQNAFLQFHLHPSNRTLLRFLWPLGIAENPLAPTKEFWSTRLEFGLSCSPWCHIKGVQHHLANCERQFPTEIDFIKEVSRNLYMDDVVFRANSVEEAKHKVKLLIEMFQSAHFPLKKWSTADENIARAISRSSPVAETEVTTGKEEAKFLGVKWVQPSDELGVFTSKALTALRSGASKRILLKALASLYDPLGMMCPVSIRAKIIFQSLWKKNIGWNDALPPDILASYNEFIDELEKCSDFKIQRALASRFSAARYELHTFCDASLEAYACTVYLRTVLDSHAETRLIFAKARVTPLKNRCSIHRYELMGAVLAARIATQTKKFLKLEIDRTFFWIDNSACVAWIHSGPERWQAFVANRVRVISQLTDRNDWFWIRSEDNPADIASRGSEISSTTSRSRWLHGPPWLKDSNWTPPTKQTVEETSEEAKSTSRCIFHTVTYNANNKVDELLSADRFSSWVKLLRAQAFCNRLRRFAQAVRSRSNNKRRPATRGRRERPIDTTLLQLQPEEYRQAECDLIKRIQRRHFATELATECRNISKASPLQQYQPFIDSEGIIRCRSRLEKSTDLPYDAKFPIIIPSDGGWAKLLILFIHAKECWHWGGVAMTLQRLRERFFVLKARRIASAVLRSCAGCKRFTAKPAAEAVAPLPEFRIEEAPPFYFCGVDFAGPLYYKTEDRRKAKSYILMFSCAVTRAIHLELTTDMSTHEVLIAVQKFINRFPSAKNFFSDNGASFRRADAEIKLIYSNISSGYMADWLNRWRISWRFITPLAPWVGAFWERPIGSVKRCLRKVLGTTIPYFRDLEAILSGVEAIVNRRPLTAVSTDPNELTALTPANLISGYDGNNTIPQSLEAPNKRSNIGAVSFSKRWIYQQRVLAAFWERYRSEYLVYLRTAMQSKPVAQRSLKKGDVCLVKDDDKSRAYWPLVRIIQLHPGSDKKARSCTVRTANGRSLVRPVKLLYPLESDVPDPLH